MGRWAQYRKRGSTPPVAPSATPPPSADDFSLSQEGSDLQISVVNAPPPGYDSARCYVGVVGGPYFTVGDVTPIGTLDDGSGSPGSTVGVVITWYDSMSVNPETGFSPEQTWTFT